MLMTLALLLTNAAQAVDITLDPGADVASLTSSLGAGDTITFNAGTYTLESPLGWTAVGEENNPITFVGNGEVILELMDGWTVVNLSDSNYVNIRNITFRGNQEFFDTEAGFDGLRISNSSNVTIENVTVENIGDNGIDIGGGTLENIIIRDSTVQFVRNDGIAAGCGDAACFLTGSSFHHNLVHDAINGDGIEIHNGGQLNEITDNVVYNVGDFGIQTHSTEYGEPNVVERNVVYQSINGIYASGAVTMRNNIIFNIEEEGIVSENERDTLEKARITHNTVYNTGEYGVRLEDWEGRDDMVFCNNAIANTTGEALRAREEHIDPATNLFSNNIVTGRVDAEELTELDGHFIPGSGAADYMGPVDWDYYPTIASTLVDAGNAGGECYIPAVDFLGNPREGDAPDVGAYERCAIGDCNPGWQVREDFKELEGNACPTFIDDGSGGGCGCGGNKDDTAIASQCAAILFPLLIVGLRRREQL